MPEQPEPSQSRDWIPVATRNPYSGEYVLVTYRAGIFPRIGVACWNSGSREWENPRWNEYCPRGPGDVTHWMALPDPAAGPKDADPCPTPAPSEPPSPAGSASTDGTSPSA